jgi:hypothetical protein
VDDRIDNDLAHGLSRHPALLNVQSDEESLAG